MSILSPSTKVKNYCVIGLGRFGTEIANILVAEKQNVLVIDSDEEVIATTGAKFQDALLLDATNINELNGLGVENYDEVIVAISSFEKSIIICSNLKELGVKNIFAKASTPIHKRILKSMGISKTIIPEIEVASRVAYKSIYGINIESFRTNYEQSNKANYFIIETPLTNPKFNKKSVSDINLVNDHDAMIIAIKRVNGEFLAPIKGDVVLNTGDSIFILSRHKNIKQIVNFFANN